MRQRKILICGLLIFLVAAVHSTAWGQTTIGPFEITGYYQYTINPATEHANPNNFACFSFIVGPCSSPPGLQKKSGKPDFLLMRQFLDLNIYGKFSENWSVTLQPRFFHDITKSADSHFRQYESLATNFPGSGWMLRGGGNDFKAEMWQAYIDYRSGNWWLRIGKQQIAWGEALGLRVLDTINPLELSQNLAMDRIFEEFDRVRVPQWFLRADYTIPNATIPDLTAELILNPGHVVPTILPKQGSPYNVVPAFLGVRDNINPGEPTVGGRLTGTIGDVQFSLNYITKPNDNGVGVFRGVIVPNCLFPAVTPTGPCILLEGRHPRVHIVGGSMNYRWDWAGAILRAETTVTPNAPFQRGAGATRIIERPVWKSVLAVDRPTYVIPGLDSMTIGFQFFETFTGGDRLNKARDIGAKVDQAVHVFTVFFQQPLFMKRVALDFFGLFDTDDAHWLQPGIHWEIGNNIRLDLYYNKLGGAEKRATRFGSNLNFVNGPFFRFTYGF
jgi:hypothetical protein